MYYLHHYVAMEMKTYSCSIVVISRYAAANYEKRICLTCTWLDFDRPQACWNIQIIQCAHILSLKVKIILQDRILSTMQCIPVSEFHVLRIPACERDRSAIWIVYKPKYFDYIDSSASIVSFHCCFKRFRHGINSRFLILYVSKTCHERRNLHAPRVPHDDRVVR